MFCNVVVNICKCIFRNSRFFVLKINAREFKVKILFPVKSEFYFY